LKRRDGLKAVIPRAEIGTSLTGLGLRTIRWRLLPTACTYALAVTFLQRKMPRLSGLGRGIERSGGHANVSRACSY